jgi:hypothetical protein
MSVLILDTLVTGDTTPDLLLRELHQFALNPLLFEFVENVFDQDGRIAVLSWAAVKPYNLHLLPPFRSTRDCEYAVDDFVDEVFTRFLNILT